MKSKAKQETPDERRARRRAIQVYASGPADLDAEIARRLTSPEAEAACTIQTFGADNYDVNALVRELSVQTAAVSRGDLKRAEGMLTAQAHTLDQLFGFLARRAHLNLREYPDATDRYLRLAFKAQAQCRATLETLSALKNPPVVYARQANFANGPQQVNNGGATRAGETENRPNELSGASHELLPNTRTSQAARRNDPPLEALAAINRAEDEKGQGN